MLKRRIVCLGLALLLLLPMVLTGCSKDWEKTTLSFDENYGNVRVPSGEVARNDRFALYWDDDAQCALLEDTVSGITSAEKQLAEAMKKMLGISPKVHLVAPKSITRSEGKAVRVVDKRKLID